MVKPYTRVSIQLREVERTLNTECRCLLRLVSIQLREVERNNHGKRFAIQLHVSIQLREVESLVLELTDMPVRQFHFNCVKLKVITTISCQNEIIRFQFNCVKLKVVCSISEIGDEISFNSTA